MQCAGESKVSIVCGVVYGALNRVSWFKVLKALIN